MKRHDKAPNGHFAEGLILYGNLEAGAMASQGFLLDPWFNRPPLEGGILYAA